MARIIDCDQHVKEAYGPDGSPVSSFWYQSEAPLTWNAGMVVYAYQVFEEYINNENNGEQINSFTQ